MRTGPRLELVTHENVRAACTLKLRPDQEDLVAPVAWSLADAYTLPDIAWPRLIYDGDQVVGFTMAAFAREPWDRLFHSYLWRLNIGAEHQGKGYGRFAVEGVCAEALRRGQHRLTVCYHPGQHENAVEAGARAHDAARRAGADKATQEEAAAAAEEEVLPHGG